MRKTVLCLALVSSVFGLPTLAAVPDAASPAPAEDNAAPSNKLDTPGAGRVHMITIVNHDEARIESVRVSSSKASDFGDDLLGSDEIDMASKGQVKYEGPCRSDIEIGFEGGSMESRRFIDICRITTIVVEPGWTLKKDFGAAN